MIKERVAPVADLTAQAVDIAGGRFRLLKVTSTPWASANFAGHRHHLILTGDQPLGTNEEQDLADIIAEHEFVLAGATVADANLTRVSPDGRTLTIELLTVDE